MHRSRIPWKRFLAILCLTLLALMHAESSGARMYGPAGSPGRILRLEPEPEGVHVHMLGWQWQFRTEEYPLLTEAPSRIREGAHGLWRQVRAWSPDLSVNRQ